MTCHHIHRGRHSLLPNVPLARLDPVMMHTQSSRSAIHGHNLVLRPVKPQNDAGWRIEPPVSVPVRKWRTRSAATAAAEPPEEPPGT